MKRKLGNTEVSALGLGCWPAGGPWNDPGRTIGWSGASDQESLLAIRTAVDLGVTLFDTSDTYSSGHSEELLGEALQGVRSRVAIATKFGYRFEEGKTNRHDLPYDLSPGYLRRALEGSLRRLKTDCIDLYQLHVWEYDPAQVGEVIETLEAFVREGKVRGYGWSTDQLGGMKAFEAGAHTVAAQLAFNVFEGAAGCLEVAEKNGWAVLCRSPLAMGLLSGKYTAQTSLPGDDVRSTNDPWIVWFKDGKPTPEYLKRLDAIRQILTAKGRTLVQGALAWLWARSPALIPIPGFKSAAQVRENVRAMEFGPLLPQEMEEVARLANFRDITYVPAAV